MILNQSLCKRITIDKYNTVSVVEDTFEKYVSL